MLYTQECSNSRIVNVNCILHFATNYCFIDEFRTQSQNDYCHIISLGYKVWGQPTVGSVIRWPSKRLTIKENNKYNYTALLVRPLSTTYKNIFRKRARPFRCKCTVYTSECYTQTNYNNIVKRVYYTVLCVKIFTLYFLLKNSVHARRKT